LLDLVNALCWADRSGERVMQVVVPMLVEALEFHKGTAGIFVTTVEEFVERWSEQQRRMFTILAAGRSANLGWPATASEIPALREVHTAAAPWHLTTLQRAILYIQH